MIGWSGDQLAEQSGVSKPTIARLELASQDSEIGGYASARACVHPQSSRRRVHQRGSAGREA